MQGIKKNNLTELRSFITPPQPILDVMKAVMSMFGIYEYTWSAMKKFLGNSDVINNILNFDPKIVTPNLR